MKAFKKSLGLLSLTFILSACSISFGGSLDWKNLKNSGEGIYAVSDKISNYKLSFDKSAFTNAMQKADDAAVYRKSIYTFSGEMNKVNSMFGSLREKTTIARAKYMLDGSMEAKNTYKDFYDTYLSFYTWYYPFLLHVKESSTEIYNAFFADMSPKEVDEYIKGFTYTERTKVLDTEINDIQDVQEEKYTEFINAYRAGTIKKDDPNYVAYMDDALTRYRSLLSRGEEYASIFGYDNYFDYVYKNYYSRDYKYDFVDSYAPLVDQYVIPAIKYYDEHVDKSILNNPTKKELFSRYISSNIADNRCFQGDLLDSYVSMMGGEMQTTYDHLKSNGLYIFSNSSTSLGTAFVSSGISDPLIFFSKNYQNVSTIVHEFGHYFAAYTNDNNDSFPFDIEETHSQANEMLFNVYLTSYYQNDSNIDVYNYIRDYNVYDMLTGIVGPLAVAEVESYIFQNLELTNEQLLSGINAIMNKYDGMVYSAYWAAPVVTSPGYYISYTTSGVAAIGAYILAQENFNKAKESYFKLVGYPRESEDIEAIFNYSGFYSPLQESTLQKFTHDNLFSF